LAEIQKVDFDTPLPEMSFEPAGNAILSKAPAQPASNDTTDLLKDLGLPSETENAATYEPPDAPEPIRPPTSIIEPEAPTPPPQLTKPAPPLLDVEPLETPPVIDLVLAPTPEPPKPEALATPLLPLLVSEPQVEQPTPIPIACCIWRWCPPSLWRLHLGPILNGTSTAGLLLSLSIRTRGSHRHGR
jgi:hypothetical protein